MIRSPGFNQHHHARHDAVPDITPLLDILFILLLFFMLTAGSIVHTLELTLPDSTSPSPTLTAQPNHSVVEITADSYALDGVRISSFELLTQHIHRRLDNPPTPEFVIQGDKNIAIERLLQVLTYLQSQQITTANILMYPSQEP